jgi:beta-glucosidase
MVALSIISSWYQLKQDDGDIFPEPGSGMPKHLDRPHKLVDARDQAARNILVDGAAEGHVLVKNIDDTLPLRSPRLLSVYGYSARAPDLLAPLTGDGDLGVEAWTFGAQAVDPSEIHDGFAGETELNISSIADGGTMIHGGGSGATTPALFTAPFEALKARAASDTTALFYDFRSARPLVDSASDACLVFGNAWASESYDRPALRDDRTDALITAVADQCHHTIVILHNAGPRLVDRIVDHPNVTAILFAHLPGQESGPALVSLLYGDTNPSGKLPYTVARNESDYGDELLRPALPEAQYVNFPQSDFDEGVYVDYRRFDRDDVDPRYEFGFGLSYTTFALSNLSAEILPGANLNRWPTGAVITGGQADLWDRVAVVSASLANTGPVNGAEVAQLYVGIPNAPTRQLRGFVKSFLAPNASLTVSFPLTRRDLSIWSTEAQRWELQEGEYNIFVGNSSRQLPLKGSFII